MICTLVAALLLFEDPIPKREGPQPVIVIGRSDLLPMQTYDTYDFIKKENLRLSGRFFCEVELRPYLHRDDPLKAVTATMRPESPSKSFTLKSVFTGVEGTMEKQPNEQPMIERMSDFWPRDTPDALTSQVFTLVEQARLRSRTMYMDYKEKIDPNPGIRPNGWTERDYGHQTVEVYVAVNAYLMNTNADGSELKIPFRMFGVERATWKIPQTSMFAERFHPDPVGDGGGVSMPEDVPYIRWNGATVPLPVAPVGKDEIKDGRSYMDIFAPRPGSGFDDLWKGPGTYGGGTDMNKLEYPQHPLPGDWDSGPSFHIPPSTVWLPSNSAHQRMLGIGGGSLNAAMTMPGTFRTLCSNMDRKMPAEGIRYYPFRNSDPIAVAISKLPAMSRVTMTGDQARNWIYTDQPSREAINKVLIPGVSEGNYLNGLYDVYFLGGLERKDVEKMIIPGLLDAASARTTSVQWALNELASTKPKEVAKWLDSKPSEMSELFTQSNKAYGERGAFLFNQFLSSPNGDIRRSALRFANSLGPNADPYLKGNLPALDTLQYSGNQAEEDMATDALGRWGK